MQRGVGLPSPSKIAPPMSDVGASLSSKVEKIKHMIALFKPVSNNPRVEKRNIHDIINSLISNQDINEPVAGVSI